MNDETIVRPDEAMKRFTNNLEEFIRDTQNTQHLKDHQKTIFEDTRQFLLEGGRRGYIEAPTGTGKTVLFVALAKALSYDDPNPPKVLVVAPTIDIVEQTRGGTGDDKGFAGFAADMQVRTLYGATPKSIREKPTAQVTVTTYATMTKLANTMLWMTDPITGDRYSRHSNRLNEFDIIFLDESHRALGENRRSAIEGIEGSKLIIGFTATPNFNEERRLDGMLPTEIHRLDLKEAIEMNMLSPIIPLAVTAPNTQARDLLVGSNGREYETASLRELIHDHKRNEMIADLTLAAIENGNTPIITCLPGDDMVHPRMIAQILSERYIDDSDGVRRQIRVAAITSAMPGSKRQSAYADLEAGRIDALTSIDILTEGWDSLKANVIINARPTRSPLAARQRLGRVLRTKSDGRPAFIVDIIDTVSSQSAPPVSVADIFDKKSVISGNSIGEIDHRQVDSSTTFVTLIRDQFSYVDTVVDRYSQYIKEVMALKHVRNGRVSAEENGKVRSYSTPERIRKRFNIDSFALARLVEIGMEGYTAQLRSMPIETYDETVVNEFLGKLPSGAMNGHYYTRGGENFIAIDDMLGILHQKYNKITLTYEDIERELLSDNMPVGTLQITKHIRHFTHRNVPLYIAKTSVAVPYAQQLVKKLAQ